MINDLDVHEGLSEPLISIVMPSYNKADFIEDSIMSVLSQDYQNLELIIFDGESTDGSVDIIRHIAETDNRIRWFSEPDEGQTDAINKGLAIASGEILAYLNADDLYVPGALTSVVDVLSKNPEIDLIYGDVDHIDDASAFLRSIKTGELSPSDIMHFWEHYIPQPSVFFTRGLFEKVGFFDKQFHLAMDHDYWVRAWMKGQTLYLPEILSVVRLYHDAKSVGERYKYYAEYLLILEKTFGNADSLPKEILEMKDSLYASNCVYGGAELIRGGCKKEGLQIMLSAKKYRCCVLLHPMFYWGMYNLVFGARIGEMTKQFLIKIGVVEW